MRRRGFTIIELLVAAGIISLILAAALPRFVESSRHQDFAASGQRLADCFRQAQGSAAAMPAGAVSSGGSPRYGVATLRSDGAGITCETAYAGSYAADGRPADPSLAASDVSFQGALPVLRSYSMDGARLRLAVVSAGGSPADLRLAPAGPSTVRIYFDSQAAGAPVAACAEPLAALDATRACTRPISAKAGLSLTLGLTGTSDTSLSGTLSVGPLGTPITYE